MNDHARGRELRLMLSKYRFRVSTEAALQADIEQALVHLGVPYLREHRLSPLDRPDFMVDDVVIEAKARYNKRRIYAQIARYAAYSEVGSVILVTNTALGMPEFIENKPIYVLPTGFAHL